MIHKPLYHGCIDAHGAVPSPDGRLLATSGRGSSNIYLIDAEQRRVIGNTPNPASGPTTNPERLSSGLLLGREPHGNPLSRATAASCGSRCAVKTVLPSSASIVPFASSRGPTARAPARFANTCPH